MLFEEGAAVRRRLRGRQRAARREPGPACTSVRSVGASWSARSACSSAHRARPPSPRCATRRCAGSTSTPSSELTAAHPALMVQLVRTMLARLGRRAEYTDRARSIAVAVTAPIDARLWVTRLANEIARHGSARHLWAARVDAALGPARHRRGRARRHRAGAVRVPPRGRGDPRLPRAGGRPRRHPLDPPGAGARRPHRRRDVGEPDGGRAARPPGRSSPPRPSAAASSAG